MKKLIKIFDVCLVLGLIISAIVFITIKNIIIVISILIISILTGIYLYYKYRKNRDAIYIKNFKLPPNKAWEDDRN